MGVQHILPTYNTTIKKQVVMMMFSNNQTMMMRNRITVRARPVLVDLLLAAVLVVMQFSASALSLTSRNTAGGILPRPQRQQGLLRDDDGIRATSEPRRMLGRRTMAKTEEEEEEDKEPDDAAAAAAPAVAVAPTPATDDAEVDKAIATLAAGDDAESAEEEDNIDEATTTETVDEAVVQEEEKEPEEAPKPKPKEEYQIKKMSDKGKKFFGDEVGAMAPLGYWDPLGFTSDGNRAKFDNLRLYEITHGRVAMLAVTGYLVTGPLNWRFPGAGDVPAGCIKPIEYLLATKDGQTIGLQMLAFFTVASILNRDAEWLDNEADFVGDFRNGSLDYGWDSFSETEKLEQRNKELNNGRAAMMGMWGLYVHELMGVSILPGGWLP